MLIKPVTFITIYDHRKAGKSKATHPVHKFCYLDHSLAASSTRPAASSKTPAATEESLDEALSLLFFARAAFLPGGGSFSWVS